MTTTARQPPEIRAIHEKRFGALLREVVAGNPFYRRRYQSAGLDLDKLVGLSDCRSLPPLSRADLVEDQRLSPPFGSNLTLDTRRYTRVHRSRTDTLPALWWLDTPESWAWQLDCGRNVYRSAGVGDGDRVLVCAPTDTAFGAIAVESAERLGALVLPTTYVDLLQRLDEWLCFAPTAFVAEPEDARTLAGVLRDRFSEAAYAELRVTIHPAALECDLEDGALWEARPFFQVGTVEIGPWAFSCEHQNGFHVNESEFIVEVLDPGSGEVVTADEQGLRRGEIVLTNLGRSCSPLIRYRTGVTAEVAWQACACGVGSTVVREATEPAPACP